MDKDNITPFQRRRATRKSTTTTIKNISTNDDTDTPHLSSDLKIHDLKDNLSRTKKSYWKRMWRMGSKTFQSLKTFISRAQKYHIIMISFFALMMVLRAYNTTNMVLAKHNDDDDVLLIHRDVTIDELRSAKKSLIEAKSHTLTPLRPIDRNKYTVRINTWRRNDQLIASVNHYVTCPGVQQIQIVWCDKDNKPPKEIIELTADDSAAAEGSSLKRVVIEYHLANSLNERFNVISKAETLGILSVDDDILRPCEAVDDGFFQWTDSPDRMLGFDHRMFVENRKDMHQLRKHSNSTKFETNDIWTYGYLSLTKKQNRYSMVLPRFCFLHLDYLNLYMKYTPRSILETIDKSFNCEDIAMSFFVSSLTNAQVPLLANPWAISSMVKLSSPGAISKTSNHKAIRDKCVDKFAYLFGLKDGYKELSKESTDKYTWNQLENQVIWHGKKKKGVSGMGVHVDEHPLRIEEWYEPRRQEHILKLQQWVQGRKPFHDLHQNLRQKMQHSGLLSK